MVDILQTVFWNALHLKNFLDVGLKSAKYLHCSYCQYAGNGFGDMALGFDIRHLYQVSWVNQRVCYHVWIDYT